MKKTNENIMLNPYIQWRQLHEAPGLTLLLSSSVQCSDLEARSLHQPQPLDRAAAQWQSMRLAVRSHRGRGASTESNTNLSLSLPGVLSTLQQLPGALGKPWALLPRCCQALLSVTL